MVPERAHHLPALAVIFGAKEAAGERPAPEDPGLIRAAGRQRPDARRAPLDRPSPHIFLFMSFGLGRISRSGNFLPAAVRLGPMQLDPEMTMIERRVMAPIAGIAERQGDVVA